MKSNEEKSYERYKQYRLNKYRYEQDQIVIPFSIIAILAAIITFWKYLLIAIAVDRDIVCVAVALLAFLELFVLR